MDEIHERVREWDSTPVGGAEGLARLAAEEFTGALVAGEDLLFLLNGRVVGSTGKPAAAFENASAHEAPGPALPLLFAMREQGGEVRTQGYTNETPLREVDETLQESSFTGYVELSENVLSGDYYLVYYGGRPLYVAFVGASGETVVGEEAFERADDEVGIYEVIDASVEVSDLPTGDEDEADDKSGGAASATGAAGAASGAAGASEATDADETDEPDESEPEPGEPTADDAAASESEPIEMPEDAVGAAPESDADEAPTEPTTDSETAPGAGTTDTDAATEPETAPESDASASEASGAEPSESEPKDAERESTTETSEASRPERTRAERTRTESPETGAGEESPSETGTEPADADRPSATDAPTNEPAAEDAEERESTPAGVPEGTVFDEEEEWRETTSIPALDPDEEAAADGETESGAPPQAHRETPSKRSGPTEQRATAEQTTREGGRSESTLREALRERTDALEERTERLNEARERVEELESELESARAEREELNETVSELRAEREELETRVEELESELSDARAASGMSGTSAGESLDPERALAGTNLFVRYGSKSQPTLESVSDGVAPEEVRTNLRLDEHTTFDDEGATVAGEPFDAFLRDSPEYAFVEWLVTDLPFEIRDTGHESGLAELYDALPDVDRAELHGSVEIETEAGETERHDFDVVLRDRMGEPLVVADLNAERDPVSGDMMAELVASANAVAEAVDIGAALYVTASFFEPGALETAESSAGGGLFGRSSKENYVKVSRKRGYHLCLVEARENSFYVTVPEL